MERVRRQPLAPLGEASAGALLTVSWGSLPPSVTLTVRVSSGLGFSSKEGHHHYEKLGSGGIMVAIPMKKYGPGPSSSPSL